MKNEVALLIMLVLPAVAPAAEKAPADTVALREITVTAVKQSAALGLAPVSETDIDATAIARMGVLAPKGLSDMAPNVFMPDYGSRITSSIYVRGLGSRMEQPVMGLIIDNVPVLNKDAYDFDMPDMQSARIIRGPQSALYGRNTMCGVIEIRTLSPLDFHGVKGAVSYGSDNDARVSAGGYMAVGSVSAMSLSAMFGHNDGHWRNEFNGRRTGAENQWSARLKFESAPSDRLKIQNVLSASSLNQSGYPYESLSTGQIAYNDTCFYRRVLVADGLTVGYNTSSLSLTAVASLQYIDDNMTLDQDFTPEPFFTLVQKKKETGVTADFVLRPRYRRSRYNWLAGAFVFGRNQIMNAPVTFLSRGISDLIVSHRNDANPNFPIEWNSESFPLISDFRTPLFGAALYHRSELSLGRFVINAAIRFDYERARLKYSSRCHTSYTILSRPDVDAQPEPLRSVDIDIDDSGRLAHTFMQFLPDIAVSYRLPGSLGSVYADVAKGYKAGGFNNQMFSEVLQQRVMGVMGLGSAFDVDRIVSYRPEVSWNFEAGAHLRFPSINLKADFAAFYIDCRDQQLTVFPPGTTTGRMMTNAGRTRSYGLEATLAYSPLTALDFNVAYGWTDARFRKFNNGKTNLAGKRIPYAPAHTLFAQGVYRIDIRSSFAKSLALSANANCAGPIWWNEENTRRQRFYAVAGASATIFGPHYSLELWGRNITSTKYHTFYFISMNNEFAQRALPARFGATLRIEI